MTTPSHVFLCIGQSNMAGRGEVLDADRQPLAGVRLCDTFGQWVDATQPLNRFASNRRPLKRQGFCLAGPFADEVRASGVDSVGLIVNAMGGSYVEQWLPPREPLYLGTLTRWVDADEPPLAGVLWHQGESNIHDTDYHAKAMKLFTTLRTELRQPDLPIVLGHVTGGDVINLQIDRVAHDLGRVAVARVDGLSLCDEVHYDRDSLVELGRRYAKAWLSLAT